MSADVGLSVLIDLPQAVPNKEEKVLRLNQWNLDNKIRKNKLTIDGRFVCFWA